MTTYTLEDMRRMGEEESHSVRKQELVRLLSRHGFERTHRNGSHDQWKHPAGVVVTVAGHGYNPQMLPVAVQQVVAAIDKVAQLGQEAAPSPALPRLWDAHSGWTQEDLQAHRLSADTYGHSNGDFYLFYDAHYPELALLHPVSAASREAFDTTVRNFNGIREAHKQKLARLQQEYGILHAHDHFAASRLVFPWMNIEAMPLPNAAGAYRKEEGETTHMLTSQFDAFARNQPMHHAGICEEVDAVLNEAERKGIAYKARVARVMEMFRLLDYSISGHTMRDGTYARVLRYNRAEVMECISRQVNELVAQAANLPGAWWMRAENPFIGTNHKSKGADFDAIDPTLVIYDNGIDADSMSHETLARLEKTLDARLACAKMWVAALARNQTADQPIARDKWTTCTLDTPLHVQSASGMESVCLLPEDSQEKRVATLFAMMVREEERTIYKRQLMLCEEQLGVPYTGGNLTRKRAGPPPPDCKLDAPLDDAALDQVHSYDDVERNVALLRNGYCRHLEEHCGFVPGKMHGAVSFMLPAVAYTHPDMPGKRFVLPALNVHNLNHREFFKAIRGMQEEYKALCSNGLLEDAKQRITQAGATIGEAKGQCYAYLPEHWAALARKPRIGVPVPGFDKSAMRFDNEIKELLAVRDQAKEQQEKAVEALGARGWKCQMQENTVVLRNGGPEEYRMTRDASGLLDSRALQALLREHAPDLAKDGQRTPMNGRRR